MKTGLYYIFVEVMSIVKVDVTSIVKQLEDKRGMLSNIWLQMWL